MTAQPQTPFDLAFSYTVQNEGGLSDVKGDRGGLTHWGITQATLSRYLGRPASTVEIKTLPLDLAKEVYHKFYWLPLGLDAFVHQACALAVFDIGVVRGIGVPPKYVQEICNAHGAKLEVDGHIGPKTLEAVNSLEIDTFVLAFAMKASDGFAAIVKANPSQQKFALGWQNRARRLATLINVPDALESPVEIKAPAPEPLPKPVVSVPAPVVAQSPVAPATFIERLKLALQVLFKA